MLVKRFAFIGNASFTNYFGKSPIHDLHFTKGAYHDVGWLQVAVDNSLAVRVRHGLADLLKNPQQFGKVFLRIFAACQ